MDEARRLELRAKQERTEQLADAIKRYVNAHYYVGAEGTIIAWCLELERLIGELEAERKG